MGRPKKIPTGVSRSVRKGVEYWYASIDGQKKYIGKGDEGRELAIAARRKDEARQFEAKQINAGFKVRRYPIKTFKQLSNWYMTRPTIQAQSMYPRKVSVAKHLLEYFGSRPVNQIEADDIEQYREKRLTQGILNGTIDLEVQVLRSMFNMAIRRKQIHPDSKPGEFVQLGEVNPRRIITDDEFEQMLDHADDDLKDLMMCGFETGMRAGEICRLTAGKVNLGVRHISGAVLDYIDLGIFDTKTKTRRTVPVSPRLKEVLKRRLDGLEPDGLVFTWGNGRAFRPSYLGEKLKPVCDKAGIVYGDKVFNDKGERIGFTFHCFRHTRTTKWVEAGYSDEIIRRATGHKSLEAYRNYVKLDPCVVMRLVGDKNPVSDNSGTKTAQSL